MYAVGLDLFRYVDMVVDDERCAAGVAHVEHLLRYGQDLLRRGILHAQLYPAAAPVEGQTSRVEVGVTLGGVCDELYGYHGSILRRLHV